MSAAHATDAELKAELRRFGTKHVDVCRAAVHAQHAAGHGLWISLSLLLAVGSVETDLENVATDGGHGRGVFQQDDRDPDNRHFLATHKGCDSGSYTPKYGNALEPGRVPTLEAGAKRCVLDLIAHRSYVEAEGVHGPLLTRAALASYNCGPAAAARGWRDGDVDERSATGDYSARVLARAAVFHRLLS